jgi:hypothetical protein
MEALVVAWLFPAIKSILNLANLIPCTGQFMLNKGCDIVTQGR